MKKYTFLFFLLFIISSTISLVYKNISDKYIITRQWNHHSEAVLAAVDSLKLLHKNLFIATKSFVFTGVPVYLERSEALNAAVTSRLAKLKQMVSDNRGQVNRLDQFAEILAAFRADREKVIDLRRKNVPPHRRHPSFIHHAVKSLSRLETMFASVYPKEKN